MSHCRKRRPPAYQVYAADYPARSLYFPLLVSERGLLDSMQRAWRAGNGVPCNSQLRKRSTSIGRATTPVVTELREMLWGRR